MGQVLLVSFFLKHSHSSSLIYLYVLIEKEGASYYKMTGLGHLPQALYNGELFSAEELNIKHLEMAVAHRMINTLIYLQREVITVCMTHEKMHGK